MKKLVLAWVGFFSVTYLLVLIVPPIWDYINQFELFRQAFKITFFIVLILIFGVAIYLMVRLLIDIYKDYKKGLD